MLRPRLLIVRNRWLPVKGFACINLCGVLLVRREARVTARLLRHELIHSRQIGEMLVVGFYAWYVVEWAVRLALTRRPLAAYGDLSMEREAYRHDGERGYLSRRRPFAWVHCLRR